VLGYLKLSKGACPDVRASPDGKIFYVAEAPVGRRVPRGRRDLTEVGFIATGVGPHGLYPSRDAKKLYVINRGPRGCTGRRGARAAWP